MPTGNTTSADVASARASGSLPSPPAVDGVPLRFVVSTIVNVELSKPLAGISAPADRPVLIVAWLCGEPIGMTYASSIDVAVPEHLAQVIEQVLGGRVRAAAGRHGVTTPIDELTEAGAPHDDCPVRSSQNQAARAEIPVSVVICTRDRNESLRICLESVLSSSFHRYELVVVDNSPGSAETESLCRSLTTERPDVSIKYVVEPRPGLSRARNAGVKAASHDLIAFVDDDERVDENWLNAIAGEFSEDDRLGCVSGLVLPAELDVPAQADFEQFGGHSKGRGFDRVVFDARYIAERQSAMYPLPPFGVGANMCFRREALDEISGFDVALGAGTATRGAEDTLAFSELLLARWRMVYAPAAVTWHYHRTDDESLKQQLTGYGLGLGAYYAALLTRKPSRIARLLGLLPGALRDLFSPDSARNARLDDLPPAVSRANMRRIVQGPFVYWRERVRNARGGQ